MHAEILLFYIRIVMAVPGASEISAFCARRRERWGFRPNPRQGTFSPRSTLVGQAALRPHWGLIHYRPFSPYRPPKKYKKTTGYFRSFDVG